MTRQYRAEGPGALFVPHISPELNISGRDGDSGQTGQDGHPTDTGLWGEPLREDRDVTLTVCPSPSPTENGTLTWEPRGTAPFSVTLQAVGSQHLAALLQLSFTLCSCRTSRECDYNDTATVNSSSLQVPPRGSAVCRGHPLYPSVLVSPKPMSPSPWQLAACRCEDGFSGPFCQHPPDPCAQGCFPGVGCDPLTGCGPCPPGLTGDGRHCSGDEGWLWEGTGCQKASPGATPRCARRYR